MSDGKRSFMAASYRRFWDQYELLSPLDRHHYEIIREGLPCHLYFGTLSPEVGGKWHGLEYVGFESASTLLYLQPGFLSSQIQCTARARTPHVLYLLQAEASGNGYESSALEFGRPFSIMYML